MEQYMLYLLLEKYFILIHMEKSLFGIKEHNCLMYETSYGLGGTSFGYILEKHIVRLANKNEVS